MSEFHAYGDKANSIKADDLYTVVKGSVEGRPTVSLKLVVPTQNDSLYDIATSLQYLIFKGNLPEKTLRQLHAIAFDKMAVMEPDEG